jgi:hypothetical protein
MRVAVTGGTGFVGRFVVLGLVRDGHAVTVLSRTPPARGDLPEAVGHLVYRLGGTETPELEGFDALVHAAFDHVPGRYRGGEGDDAAGFLSRNLGGSLTLFGAAPFTKGEKPPFHTPLDSFAKLRLWQLDYERVVFLDADTLVLRNVDRLFEYPEFSAAPNVYESLGDFHRLNSGVFVARPSEATFAAMLAALDVPGAFWKRTDQTFLQSFFPDWHGLPVFDNMLQYVWLNLPELWDWGSVRVLHYQYEKPWQEGHPKAARLAPLIELWRAYAGDGPVPAPDGLPAPR